MILSVSRRTDIPAFYGDWFINRLKEGFLYVRNPMNIHQVSKIQLSPDKIECIVFWTKNPSEDFINNLKVIDELGYRYYFQFSVTSYDKSVEVNIPKKAILMDRFIRLSNIIGKEKVIWRYDPIFFNEHYNFDYHKKWFEYIAEKLETHTEKCVISFLDYYSKIRSRLILNGIPEVQEQQMQEFLKRTSGVPVENSMLIDREKIMELNDELQKYYKMKMDSERTNKDHTQMKLYLTLENELLQVLTMDITLKMKYLKLTRVTKKIQEVVTGKEEINQAQIAKLYEDKKRNLEENTAKRIATLDKKFREINNDIKKKVEENHAFSIKLNHLKEDVVKTQQIIDLDEDVEKTDEMGYAGEEHKPGVVPNKSLEIAEVSKLKSIVKNYYEEIEYLRAELDKLRARTFPSFLQKPDNVIYPDEK